MKTIRLFVIAIIVLIPALSFGDGGLIPISPDARMFEPNQNALIAWDGKEEILILSTDLSSSKPTKVLEVVPIPSEPKVEKGDIEVFKRATHIINTYGANILYLRNSPFSGTGGSISIPAGEVTFHEKIGPHDINVTRVNDTAGFIKWVEDYLKELGQDMPKIPEPIKQAVGKYLKDGFQWFVFDVIELDKETKTRDAIQYRFKSNRVFYPMRISRAQEGDTEIKLIVMTPELLTTCHGVPKSKLIMLNTPLALSTKDLKKISEDISEFFGKKKASSSVYGKR